MSDKIEKFIDEIKALQDKYEVVLGIESEEEIDYDWEETPYIFGYKTYFVVYDCEDSDTTYYYNSDVFGA